ncbi:hypothetical protein D0S45_02205 [Marinifilum sp. JC120]|nr:hypothetical protein D0S45_02205 [Marinifilum sp. JC120]
MGGGSGGGLSSLMGSFGGVSGGGISSLTGQGTGVFSSLMSSSGTSGASSGATSSTGGSLLGGGIGGNSYMGMMSQFGQSVLGSSQARGEVEYNSQMTEMNNYHLMQQGVYNRRVNYKEAELIKQDAEIKLATLRRELYRRNHSISGHKGVRLDSGSVVDVREDTIKQAAYDAEIVKYQAEVSSNRMIERGDLSVWSAHSKSVLNYNQTQEETNTDNSAINSGLMNQGMSMAGSLLSSKMGG